MQKKTFRDRGVSKNLVSMRDVIYKWPYTKIFNIFPLTLKIFREIFFFMPTPTQKVHLDLNVNEKKSFASIFIWHSRRLLKAKKSVR